ncbi:cyclic GMP-AMP synthase-like isoform X1 [Stylophora pistillata]|nr:cyclic GMP-AMP synthase-like isoform X1 [Stylophora pistillata]XP_022795059.1 cyclic GMP-AMP synthase-like isoform X1 [Stylophora pistillata]XP_022795061.1 cyclic GMP-AMP synthase-like isoform X1 [Stylophora pistillata]
MGKKKHRKSQPQIMALDASSLTRKLHVFSAKYVKISEETTRRARRLVKDYIEGQIIAYITENSNIEIQKLEYTGSFYEGLKTENADEADIMVVLKTPGSGIEVVQSQVPGYVHLKARDAPMFSKYMSPKGYIKAKKLRNSWFQSYVRRAVNKIEPQPPHSEVRLVVRSHGPAVQVDIIRKGSEEMLLSVDLVPCFQVEDSWYVPKPFKGKRYLSRNELLWRKTFSPKEKQILASMDKDPNGQGGCRHELLRIVKTVVKKPVTSLPLDSYHLKAAFMHYNDRGDLDWVSEDALGKNFFGFLMELQIRMESRNLPNYWLDGINLLDDFKEDVVKQMANRLRRILNSEVRLNKILE